MKKYLKLFLVVILATMTLPLTSCKDDKDEPDGGDIVGTWKEKSIDLLGITHYLQLRADGTAVTINIIDDSWSWSDSKIEVDYGKWSKKGDTLTIIDDDVTTKATIIKLTSKELGVSMWGLTTYYERVPDSEVDKYLP